MKIKSGLGLLLISLGLLGSCKSLTSPSKTSVNATYKFRIKGTVTDTTDNSPVPKASVIITYMTWSGQVIFGSTETNGQGQYSLEANLTSESNPAVMLSVRAEGYAISGATVKVTSDWQTIDFRLDRVH